MTEGSDFSSFLFLLRNGWQQDCHGACFGAWCAWCSTHPCNATREKLGVARHSWALPCIKAAEHASHAAKSPAPKKEHVHASHTQHAARLSPKAPTAGARWQKRVSYCNCPVACHVVCCIVFLPWWAVLLAVQVSPSVHTAGCSVACHHGTQDTLGCSASHRFWDEHKVMHDVCCDAFKVARVWRAVHEQLGLTNHATSRHTPTCHTPTCQTK